jgi:DNA-binding NarL/FixJ family response regulator
MADPTVPITVMIVDDHDMVRRGAFSYLEALPGISVVAQAGSGEEVVRGGLAGQPRRYLSPDPPIFRILMTALQNITSHPQVMSTNTPSALR